MDAEAELLAALHGADRKLLKSELAERAGVSCQTVSRRLPALQEKGFVVETVSVPEDSLRMRNFYGLSSQGRQRAEQFLNQGSA